MKEETGVRGVSLIPVLCNYRADWWQPGEDSGIYRHSFTAPCVEMGGGGGATSVPSGAMVAMV